MRRVPLILLLTASILTAGAASAEALSEGERRALDAQATALFDEGNAAIIVRACSALRLRLRRHDLHSLGDEQLESGAVELETLAEPLQKPFMCYVFLGTIQELIIQHLDSAILRGPLGEGAPAPEEDEGEEDEDKGLE